MKCKWVYGKHKFKTRCPDKATHEGLCLVHFVVHQRISSRSMAVKLANELPYTPG